MRPLVVCIAVLSLSGGGCAAAPLRWDRADTDQAMQELDQAECRSRARSGLRAERRFERERLLGRAQDEAVQQRAEETEVARRLGEEDHYRLVQRLFVDCMEGKGYHQVPFGRIKTAGRLSSRGD
ncbi:MAG: hypothetical protein FJX68_10665 [Alphaproteobacteria bacterium]|nr:hypothetical protein [Alphaproteobacteria bacterium]